MTSPWLRRLPGSGTVRTRLVCLPHAGGGPAAFHGWRRLLPDDVELLLAHLPGRESRLGEPPPTDLATIIDELADALGRHDRVVLFGHSWGAWIGIALARRLGSTTSHLVVSGAVAPHCPRPLPPISHLPHDEFLARMAALGGIPAPVLAHEELMSVLAPAMRADMRLAESVTPAREPLVACPITALWGTDDLMTTPSTVSEWASYTSAEFSDHAFEGGHFFPYSASRSVVAHLAEILESLRS